MTNDRAQTRRHLPWEEKEVDAAATESEDGSGPTYGERDDEFSSELSGHDR